jgi:hypothetical protein
MEVMNTMWSSRSVPEQVLQGVITLVPKSPRPRRVKDLRPITLLDVDAKILARLMVRRLSVLQNKLLHPNQVRPGGVRTMTGALCDLRDVISACGALRVPGAVLSTDFSDAFDAVHHDFLYEVLWRRGVSPHFIAVLRAMYTGAGSRLLVNGVLTQSFPVLRSVRQGCPLSMVLAPLLQYLERRQCLPAQQASSGGEKGIGPPACGGEVGRGEGRGRALRATGRCATARRWALLIKIFITEGSQRST